MAKFPIDGSALALAVLAAVFGFSLLPGPFSWLASIAGLVLAIILLSFDREGVRSLFESLGFAAAVGLCLTLAAAVVFRAWLGRQGQPTGFDGALASEYLPLFWVAVTVFVWVIDRTRMSGRMPYGTLAAAPAVQPRSSGFSFIPTPVAATVPVPVPVPEPAAALASPLRGAFTQPSFGSAPEAEPSPPPVPSPSLAPELPRSEPIEPTAPLPSPFSPVPAPASVPPPPAAIPIPAGREATIYVTLVGEGLNVLRAVRAEHLGRDFYRIVEEMPPGETWQFGPGQVVRCKKKNLSSGKAMVAVEEAPRATGTTG